VGLVPILDNGTCNWAAIDIDNHGNSEDIPIGPIDINICNKRLPVIACRSKSGGVHVYAFFATPWTGIKAQALMTSFAQTLGFAKAEIFPKQAHLRPGAGAGEDKQLGNWLNMPYLGGDATVRYAYRDGRRLGLVEFLDLAEGSRITQAEVYSQIEREHPEAPPCVQRMMAEGVGTGQRNEAMYNMTVYARKAFPKDYTDRAREFNIIVFDKPLPRAELERTIGSAGRPEYRYRCNEEPQKSYCDRPTCLTRACGITPAEGEIEKMLVDLPAFTELVKYVAEPVRWEMKVNGKRMTNIATEVLTDWRKLRLLIAEYLTYLAPMIKAQEWERILSDLMANARIVDVPDDASTAGAVRERLREFASKAENLHKNAVVADRGALLRGLPILADIDGTKQVVFRAQDFAAYLKRSKSEELKGVNTWFAVRELGVETTRMRVTKDKCIHVWMMPYTEIMDRDVDAPEIKSEL
jgi:hypothetical protein